MPSITMYRRKPVWRALVVGFPMIAVLALTQVPVQADIGGYNVTGTGGVGLKVRTDPYSPNAGVVAVLADGTPFSAVCAVRGRDVSGNTAWHRISAPAAGWIADYYTTTPGFNQYIPGELDCNAYNRNAARDWAYAHYQDAERYPNSDCTWFVSQALWSGWLPRTDSWTDSPSPSVSAINADAFANMIVGAGLATSRDISWSDNTAGGAQVGDVIAYNWNASQDATIDHLALVTFVNAQGYPSVTQHSTARRDRYWSWDPENNGWIENTRPGSRARLIHITR